MLAIATDYVLALATLGGMTQIGSILFPLLGQGKWGRQFHVAISSMFLHINFAKLACKNVGDSDRWQTD